MLEVWNRRQTGLAHPWFSRCVLSRVLTDSLTSSRYKEFGIPKNVSATSLQFEIQTERYMLSGFSNGSVKLYDINLASLHAGGVNRHEPVATSDPSAHKTAISSVQWYTPDSGVFITGSLDKTVGLWDAHTFQIATMLPFPGEVYSVSMSNNAKRPIIAVGCESEQVQICDIVSGRIFNSLNGHKGSVYTTCWDVSNENLLFSGSEDGSVKLWDLRGPFCLLTFDKESGNKASEKKEGRPHFWMKGTSHNGSVRSTAPSPDGRFLYSSASDSTIHQWSLLSGKKTSVEFKGPKFSQCSGEKKMALTLEGSRLFHPSGNGIQVFDTTTGNLKNTLVGHFEEVNSCLYYTKEEELISTGMDSQILVWAPEIGQFSSPESPNERKFSEPWTLPNEDAWSDDEFDRGDLIRRILLTQNGKQQNIVRK